MATAKGWRKRQIVEKMMIKEPEDEAFEELERAQQRRELLVDKGCAERGCMGYDDRDGDTPVKMSIQRPWVELTDEEIQKCYEASGHYQTLRPQDRFAVFALARAVEQLSKEKNHE